jgi:hypothetical protein
VKTPRMKLLSLKPVVGLLAVLAISAGALGCADTQDGIHVRRQGSVSATSGRAHQGVVASGREAPPGTRSDKDYDATSNTYYDNDDMAVVSFGRPASQSEARRVAAFVKRYYSIAAAGDGAAASSLIYPLSAEAVGENYAVERKRRTSPGMSCGEALSMLFRERHRELVGDSAHLKVAGVRVDGTRAYALLDTGTPYRSSLYLRRESGAWKVEGTPLGEELS